jgi:hypothetical protein
VQWWQRILRIADFSLPEFTDRMATEAVRRKKDLSFDAEHLGVFEVKGGERGVFYFKSKVAAEQRDDFLGPYLEEAHRAGIKVLVYFNVHWLESGFGASHPDWLQRTSAGAVIDDVYGKGCSPCVNSPPYRAWSFQVIRDLARYPIDGIFLDGPIFVASGCWCDACRGAFRTRFAKELPSRENWEDAAWKEFIEFRYDSITSYMRDARAALKRARSDAIIYMNGQGLWPSWPNGRDNRRLAAHQDIVGAEGGFLGGDLNKVSLWKPSMSAKLLETQAGGKPTVIFIAGHHCGWDLTCLTPAETRLLYAQTIAHGSSPWYGMFYDTSDDPGAHAAGEMNAFIKRSARYLEGTAPVGDVALLWSSRTADYYRATVPVTDFTQNGDKLTRQERSGDHYRAFSGWFECLTRRRVQFDVLDEHALEDSLERYAVLILPNVACISQDHAAVIAAWVASGGHVVATHETSFYTDWGVRRTQPALRDVLGIESSGIEGPTSLDYFDRADDPLFAETTSALVAAPRYWTRTELAGGAARALSFYRGRLPARYQPLPPPSSYPAIVRSSHGRGSSVYFAGTIDEAYLEYRFPDHAALMAASVEEKSTRHIALEAPSTVQAVLRQQRPKRRVLLHLVNATGEMARPLTGILALERLAVTLPSVKGASSALFLTPGEEAPREIPVKAGRKGGVEVRVPRLDAYGIVVLEGATIVRAP